MAKQKGIIPLSGTLGEISFYYLNGTPVARSATAGFNKKAIKTKPSMQRVRENASEFGHCTKVNKALRQALRPFYAEVRFTYLHSRLNGLLTRMKKLDATHIRGERTVAGGYATAAGQHLFTSFTFTPACTIWQGLLQQATYTNLDFTLSFASLSAQGVIFPEGATHFKLLFGVLGADFGMGPYTLFLASPVIVAAGDAAQAASFTPAETPQGASLVPFFGVQFLQEVNGELYALRAQESVGFGPSVPFEG